MCQDGSYNLTDLPGVFRTGSAVHVMHTGAKQSNTIGLVGDGTYWTLYVNATKIFSISEPNAPTSLGSLTLGGHHSNGSNAEAIYTGVRL